MISLVKLKIFTPLQKMPKNVRELGKLLAVKAFEKLPKVQKLPNLVTLPESEILKGVRETLGRSHGLTATKISA